jgi:hypothetical protein
LVIIDPMPALTTSFSVILKVVAAWAGMVVGVIAVLVGFKTLKRSFICTKIVRKLCTKLQEPFFCPCNLTCLKA